MHLDYPPVETSWYEPAMKLQTDNEKANRESRLPATPYVLAILPPDTVLCRRCSDEYTRLARKYRTKQEGYHPR